MTPGQLSLLVASVLFVAGCGQQIANAADAANTAEASTDIIPARQLDCVLGHALNLDPTKEQSLDDIEYEGQFSFSLYLPATRRSSAPPPDATEPAAPVDPATRVIGDPAGLRRGVPEGFARVVDLWPNRVEMTQVVSGSLVHLMIINPIDEQRGTANLFMTTATDVAAMNLKTVYQGPCKVALNPTQPS